MVENLWAAGLRPNPVRGSLQRSPEPLAGGEGACCPLAKNSTSLSAFGSSASVFDPSVPLPNEKSCRAVRLARPWWSVVVAPVEAWCRQGCCVAGSSGGESGSPRRERHGQSVPRDVQHLRRLGRLR